jgi:hypothetical protein
VSLRGSMLKVIIRTSSPAGSARSIAPGDLERQRRLKLVHENVDRSAAVERQRRAVARARFLARRGLVAPAPAASALRFTG